MCVVDAACGRDVEITGKRSRKRKHPGEPKISLVAEKILK